MNRSVLATRMLLGLAVCASAGQVPRSAVTLGVPLRVHATGDLATWVRQQMASIPVSGASGLQIAGPERTILQDNRPLDIYRRIGRERYYNR